MPDFITIGEAIIDFVGTEQGLSVGDVPAFEKRVGGAPVNLAIGIASLGTTSGFIGKVGEDPFGRFLISEMKRFGVDTSRLCKTKSASTPLAFVSHLEDGERSFSFYNKSNANFLLDDKDIDPDYITQAKIFHFSTLSLAQDPARSATWKAVDIASRGGVVISFDPNLRFNFWPNPSQAEKLCRAEIKRALPIANILRMNIEEGKWISGLDDTPAMAKYFHKLGPVLVIITKGKYGAYYSYNSGGKEFEGEVKGIQVNTIDTTGAGDAFLAMLLYRLSKRSTPIIEGLEHDEIREICSAANELAAKVTTVRGAITFYS